MIDVPESVWWRRWLIALGLWIARCAGWEDYTDVLVRHLPPADLLEAAIRITAQLARRPGASGEFKRHEALRALLNMFPDARERDCALAIELAIR